MNESAHALEKVAKMQDYEHHRHVFSHFFRGEQAHKLYSERKIEATFLPGTGFLGCDLSEQAEENQLWVGARIRRASVRHDKIWFHHTCVSDCIFKLVRDALERRGGRAAAPKEENRRFLPSLA